MREIRVDESGSEDAAAEASRVIFSGGLVLFPTETFYCVAARYDSAEALEKIYRIKKRPSEKNMPLMAGHMSAVSLVSAGMNEIETLLAAAFWPGPLTLLLEARKGLHELITGPDGKVAVRIPGRSFALQLLRMLPYPVTATSANVSGMPAASDAATAKGYFPDGIDLIIDAGETPGGPPSTIVDASGGTIRMLRHGAVPEKEILKCLQGYE